MTLHSLQFEAPTGVIDPAAPEPQIEPRKRKAKTPPAMIPALDGLRGIAVLGVLFFHLRLRGFSLGWAGVELFFVLSGFLITRILLNTREDAYYFRNFYLRRALRIFPIYYLVLITYTIATLAATGRGLGTLSLYYIYLQTFPQISSQFGAMPMLGHTWTLAIEEQFYFLWPLVVFLVRGRKLVLVMIVMMAVALGLRFASLGWANPFLIDGWLGVQVDALAAGAMVAYASLVWDPETLKRWSVRAFVVGTGALLALIASAGVKVFWTPLSWGRMWWGPLLISILACAFAGAVGMAATEHPWTRWLTFRPLRRWGKISYGIYLYHPFTYLAIEIAIGRFGHPQGRAATAAIALAKLLLTYLAAWLSWTWIEAPLNHLKERFTRY